MLMRFVTIVLVIVQVVVPQGMCICHLLPHVAADAHESHADEAESSTCCCCTAPSPGGAGDAHEKSDLRVDANPVGHPHLPSCPALRPADAKMVQAVDPMLIAALLTHVNGGRLMAAPQTPFPIEVDASPPVRFLYLAYGALLI